MTPLSRTGWDLAASAGLSLRTSAAVWSKGAWLSWPRTCATEASKPKAKRRRQTAEFRVLRNGIAIGLITSDNYYQKSFGLSALFFDIFRTAGLQGFAPMFSISAKEGARQRCAFPCALIATSIRP